MELHVIPLFVHWTGKVLVSDGESFAHRKKRCTSRKLLFARRLQMTASPVFVFLFLFFCGINFVESFERRATRKAPDI